MLTTLLSLFLNPVAAELVLVPNYKCQVIVVVESREEGLYKKFMADFASGSHGGREYRFSNEFQDVTVLASNNWMALRWEKKNTPQKPGRLIGEAHFAISQPSDFHRVVMLKNPANPDEQATLDCTPENLD